MLIVTTAIVLMAIILAYIIRNLNEANEGAIASNIDKNLRSTIVDFDGDPVGVRPDNDDIIVPGQKNMDIIKNLENNLE